MLFFVGSHGDAETDRKTLSSAKRHVVKGSYSRKNLLSFNTNPDNSLHAAATASHFSQFGRFENAKCDSQLSISHRPSLTGLYA